MAACLVFELLCWVATWAWGVDRRFAVKVEAIGPRRNPRHHRAPLWALGDALSGLHGLTVETGSRTGWRGVRR